MPFPYLEAEFADGFVIRDDEDDVSPFVYGKNVFDDLLYKRYEPAHGDMVRVAFVTARKTYTVDWTTLPNNARPIFYTVFKRTADFGTLEWLEEKQRLEVHFGYQYTDIDPETNTARNRKETAKITEGI